MYTKFYKDSSKTERLVGVVTDAHGYIDSNLEASQEYIQ